MMRSPSAPPPGPSTPHAVSPSVTAVAPATMVVVRLFMGCRLQYKGFEVARGRCPKKEVRRDHATGNRNVHVPDSTANLVVPSRSATERTPAARVAVSPSTVIPAGSAKGTTTVAGSPGGIVTVHVTASSSRLQRLSMRPRGLSRPPRAHRSEEHTSELQSRGHLV